jgi:hypothetical protein
VEMAGSGQYTSTPRIGENAPAFKAITTQGEIDFAGVGLHFARSRSRCRPYPEVIPW